MPHVTINTGIAAEDGREETLSEYLCDWPDCPNVASHVIGIVRELRTCTAVCADHAAQLASRANNDSACS
jgi:hypothetical protein